MGCVEGSKIVVSKAVCMDVYRTGCLSAGKCDFIFASTAMRLQCVQRPLFFIPGSRRTKGWNWTTCAVSAIEWESVSVVLQCVWIYSDDIFLLCGNDADRSGKGTKRALERDDPKRSFYFGDRLCHCFVVVYSKCNSHGGFSGKRDIERKRGTVCEIPVQAIEHQNIPEKEDSMHMIFYRPVYLGA